MSDPEKPKFYRMLRDTMFHVTGDIILLTKQQVVPHMHEEVTFEADNHADVEALVATIDRHEKAIRELANRLDHLETAATNPASPPEETRSE